MKKVVLIVSLILFLTAGFGVEAAILGETLNFNIEPGYDTSGRMDLTATLVKSTEKIYFYVDSNWWKFQNTAYQREVLNNLESLSKEFKNKIYPDLISLFGSEWNPGIDGDEKITLLFHQMPEGVGGYFRVADEHLKIEAPESNEREMLYLPLSHINSSQLKVFLAHEFVHLITFNQKDITFGIGEEVWLNEARAEYASTILGYDTPYQGSNLQRRVQLFLENSSDSITEWQGKKQDYGALSLFSHYLVDHYGIEILSNSLKSELVGVPSLNEALKKGGFNENFSQIFTDWTIAVFVNNCVLGQKYCYFEEALKNVLVNPSINFLPLMGKSSLTVTNITKNWSGNWLKVIGGNGVLKLEFEGLTGLDFEVPYLIRNKAGDYSLNFLVLDENQKGEVYIQDFGEENRSLTIIPSLQTKIKGFDGVEGTYPFTFSVSIVDRTPEQEAELIEQLLAQIELLKKQIAELKAKIAFALNKESCQSFNNNLYFGMNNPEVKCLQEFLKSQSSEIYPEGLVTGYFGNLTLQAVIHFQEKYSQDILLPLSLEKGTGFVGRKTREKINEILGR